jgi:hypothetical protein
MTSLTEEVLLEKIAVPSFDREVVLVKSNGQAQPLTHSATLGLLLNRVKRMRVRKSTTIETVCGDTTYRVDKIAELLASASYQQWLARPTVYRMPRHGNARPVHRASDTW